MPKILISFVVFATLMTGCGRQSGVAGYTPILLEEVRVEQENYGLVLGEAYEFVGRLGEDAEGFFLEYENGARFEIDSIPARLLECMESSEANFYGNSTMVWGHLRADETIDGVEYVSVVVGPNSTVECSMNG